LVRVADVVGVRCGRHAVVTLPIPRITSLSLSMTNNPPLRASKTRLSGLLNFAASGLAEF
jgi:hypothetical protein